jgi:hypothetical protein
MSAASNTASALGQHPRARLQILVVGVARADAGVLLDHDLVAVRHIFPGGRWA